jgi:hypothetical protein
MGPLLFMTKAADGLERAQHVSGKSLSMTWNGLIVANEKHYR